MGGTAARYFDGATATPQPATVRLDDAAVIIEVAGAPGVRWPRRQVRGADLLAPDGSVMLRCDGQPGRLQLTDPAIQRALRPPARELRWLVALAFGLLAAGGAAFYTGLPMLSLAARAIPETWQDRLGDAAVRDGFATAARCQGRAGQAALDRLTARLAAAGGIAGPVAVTVLASPQVNAFALPARRVVVLQGLLGRMQDGTEFAGVLGHELGHVMLRDPMVGVLRAQLLAAAGALSGLGSAMSAAPLLTLSYSRRVEARADANALRLLQEAGLRSDGLARALGRLDQAGGAAQVGWLSDHPLTPDRIAASAGSAAGQPPLSDAEWSAIQAMCQR